MKINGNEIKPGNVILHNGLLLLAVKCDHVKPGKGGAFAQVELRDVVSGTKYNERFRASESVERVRLEQKDYQYLYEQGDMLVFMDTENYEQIELAHDFVGERAAFLQDGMQVMVESYEGKPLGISLPGQVTLEDRRGRPGGQGPDGVVLLQARQAGERPAYHGPALYRRRRAGGGRHQRGDLHPAGRLGPVEYQGCGAGLTGLAQIHGAEEEGHAGIFDDEAA